MNIFKTLLYAIVIYYGWKFVSNLFASARPPISSPNNPPPPPPNQNKNNRKSDSDDSEYVDYEEIK